MQPAVKHYECTQLAFEHTDKTARYNLVLYPIRFFFLQAIEDNGLQLGQQ